MIGVRAADVERGLRAWTAVTAEGHTRGRGQQLGQIDTLAFLDLRFGEDRHRVSNLFDIFRRAHRHDHDLGEILGLIRVRRIAQGQQGCGQPYANTGHLASNHGIDPFSIDATTHRPTNVGRRPAPGDGRSDAGLRAQPTPSPLGIFLSLGTPRPVDGRPRQVGFLARGLESHITFPDVRIQWFSM